MEFHLNFSGLFFVIVGSLLMGISIGSAMVLGISTFHLHLAAPFTSFLLGLILTIVPIARSKGRIFTK